MLQSIKLTPDHVDQIPAFRFREEPVQTVLLRVTPRLLWLIGASVFVSLLAFWALLRYPIAS